jgi:hypothetical protein
MVAVPGANPVTQPVVISTVATDVLLLLQVPPGVASTRPTEVPLHVDVDPAIGAGPAVTVTVFTAAPQALV